MQVGSVENNGHYAVFKALLSRKGKAAAGSLGKVAVQRGGGTEERDFLKALLSLVEYGVKVSEQRG